LTVGNLVGRDRQSEGDLTFRMETVVTTVDSRVVRALAVLQVKPSAVTYDTLLDHGVEGY
jgi:hypothetical protein